MIIIRIKQLLFLGLLMLICRPVFAETKDIQITAPVLAGRSIPLGYYSGSFYIFCDTIILDVNGKGFSAKTQHQGIYFFVMPDKSFFEFMVSTENFYQFTINKSETGYDFEVKSNRVSEAFHKYIQQSNHIIKSIDSLNALGAVGDTSISIPAKKMIQINKTGLERLKEQYRKDYAGTFLGSYLNALTLVSLQSSSSGSVPDEDGQSLFKDLQYYQEHYLDNLDLNDERLIYTPVLTDRIFTYLDKIITQKPDTINYAIDNILGKIQNKHIQNFLIDELLSNYSRMKHQAIKENVYVHIVTEYYLKRKVAGLKDQSAEALRKEIIRIKPAMIGQKAPGLLLPGEDNLTYSLNDLNSDYTILLFYDIECEHCKRLIIDLKKVCTKYNYMNIRVFTIYTGKKFDEWIRYESIEIPPEWINTYQDKTNNAASVYNVKTLPTMFLLNQNNIIINKQFSVVELDKFLFSEAGNPDKTNYLFKESSLIRTENMKRMTAEAAKTTRSEYNTLTMICSRSIISQIPNTAITVKINTRLIRM